MSILPLFQELELIDEVRFDEVEGAFKIERQSVVDLRDKRNFQIATHQFFKDDEYIYPLYLPLIRITRVRKFFY